MGLTVAKKAGIDVVFSYSSESDAPEKERVADIGTFKKIFYGVNAR
jgi:hypothetical protein